MHVWIVLAAFAFAAVTPFMAAPSANTDTAQLTQDLEQGVEAAEEVDEA
jgi:hypothetical protein